MRTILLLLLVAAVGLVALKLLVPALEPMLAFYPVRGLDVTPAQLGIPYDPIEVRTSDGERLHVWRLPAPGARAEVLYFHGNGGNLSIWLDILLGVRQRGVTVVAPDYRGYGLSSGSPSERGLYRDVEGVVHHFWSELHREGTPVVYWGRSLGAAAAAHAATVREPDGLILEAAFPDVRSLRQDLPLLLRLLAPFASYRFPTAELLRGNDRPVLVLHGDADTIVPPRQGRLLFERLEGEKQFYVVAGGDHNDGVPPDSRGYWGAVDAFLRSVTAGF